MADFEVLIERVAKVEEHPNADRLTINHIRGYRCISAKKADGTPRYREGDLVVYIPEDSIVPEEMLRCGFWDNEKDKGILAGRNGDRVKAIKLRGTLSQGILFSVNPYEGYDEGAHYVLSERFPDVNFTVGQNVAELLSVTKYVPKIPESMAGEVCGLGSNIILKFDIENYKKYPDVIPMGTEVYMEEKIHGTCFISFYNPDLNHGDLFDHKFGVISKGLGAQGLAFKNNEKNENNLYVKAFRALNVQEKLKQFSDLYDGQAVSLLGEVYGEGVQDLGYSTKEKTIRFFGAYVGTPSEGRYLDPVEKYKLLEQLNLNSPPVLYKGPLTQEAIDEHTNGKSSLDGKTVREGVVITPAKGFYDPAIGRAILKSVSPDYLLRKGETTEFQ